MTTVTGGKAVVESVRTEGVKHVFGLICSDGGADVPNPPNDKFAALSGAKGFRVERTEPIEDAVRAALTCGKPAVVDVQIDPSALYRFRRDSFKHREKSVK